jgi:thiamine-phosphate pyrophosphorylase
MMGPIYVITDPMARLPVLEQARAAALGGAACLQLRDKHIADADFESLVAKLLPQMTALGVRLIVNDRVDVAIRSGAHGLHIGQGDGDPRAIRQRLPASIILGLSVENEEQARQIPPGVDYIGVGPVRATATKPDHAAPIGFAGLARIIGAAGLPAYAIGGIKQADVAVVKQAGAMGMAVVSAVTHAPDPVAATRALVKQWSGA